MHNDLKRLVEKCGEIDLDSYKKKKSILIYVSNGIF